MLNEILSELWLLFCLLSGLTMIFWIIACFFHWGIGRYPPSLFRQFFNLVSAGAFARYEWITYNPTKVSFVWGAIDSKKVALVWSIVFLVWLIHFSVAIYRKRHGRPNDH